MPYKTIPPISELRQICQSCKFARDKRRWRILWRKLSIYITWVLLHTSITANQVSAVTVLLGILSTILLAFASPLIALCGPFVYVVYVLLDKVDGEIARYSKRFSVIGVYFDELGHNFSEAGIFVGLGLHLAWQNTQGSVYILAAAMIGALCMILIRSNKSISFLIFAQNILAQPELLPEQQESKTLEIFTRQATHEARSQGRKGALKGGKKLLSWFRDFMLAISQSTVMIMLIIVGLIIEILTQNHIFLKALLKVEVLLQMAILFSLVVINIAGNISNECLRIDELAKKRYVD